MHNRCSALTLLALAAGCGSALPPSRPTPVEIVNQSSKAIFVSDDELPFRLLDTLGSTWRADTDRGFLCSECDAICESDIHADPIPVWREIKAGKAFPIVWDGLLYAQQEKGCSCGYNCYQPAALPDADFDFVLGYEHTLPADHAPYRECTAERWCGSGLGFANPTQEKQFRVSYRGQRTVTLTFAE